MQGVLDFRECSSGNSCQENKAGEAGAQPNPALCSLVNAGGVELWVLIEPHSYCCLFLFFWVLLEVRNVLPIKQIPTVNPGMEELQLSS